MNTFLAKIVVLALFSALFQGCASVPPLYTGGVSVYGNRYGTSGVVTAPCQPFDATLLMSWGNGLGNSQHYRSANVSTNNGYVNCSTTESASSRTGVR